MYITKPTVITSVVFRSTLELLEDGAKITRTRRYNIVVYVVVLVGLVVFSSATKTEG